MMWKSLPQSTTILEINKIMRPMLFSRENQNTKVGKQLSTKLNRGFPCTGDEYVPVNHCLHLRAFEPCHNSLSKIDFGMFFETCLHAQTPDFVPLLTIPLGFAVYV